MKPLHDKIERYPFMLPSKFKSRVHGLEQKWKEFEAEKDDEYKCYLHECAWKESGKMLYIMSDYACQGDYEESYEKLCSILDDKLILDDNERENVKSTGFMPVSFYCP